MNCPKCNRPMIGVEYSWDHPAHYDGVSEWQCGSCILRLGRWSGQELKDGECERRYGGPMERMETADEKLTALSRAVSEER